MDDEDTSKPALPKLDDLSVDDLDRRIAELEAEIQACREERARKIAHKSAADALFGKP